MIQGSNLYQNLKIITSKIYKKGLHETDEEYQPLIITIFDNFNRRVLDSFKQNACPIFVDSTASLEEFNLPFFCFSIATPFGGLPIGFSIVSDETEATLTEAFKPFVNRFPQSPVFMTDDCVSLRKSLRSNWPDSSLLLCSWHYTQALWTYILDGKNGVGADIRQAVINDFTACLYETNEKLANEKMENMLQNQTSFKLKKKLSKEKERFPEWGHSYRSNKYTKYNFKLINKISK